MQGNFDRGQGPNDELRTPLEKVWFLPHFDIWYAGGILTAVLSSTTKSEKTRTPRLRFGERPNWSIDTIP